jgi:type II secretory pathway component PulK
MDDREKLLALRGVNRYWDSNGCCTECGTAGKPFEVCKCRTAKSINIDTANSSRRPMTDAEAALIEAVIAGGCKTAQVRAVVEERTPQHLIEARDAAYKALGEAERAYEAAQMALPLRLR